MKRISLEDFVNRVSHILGRRIHSNEGQHQAIVAPKDESLFIVAGPGSGKTTVITLRVLKLIFVDGVKPEEIIVTTFTRKAAAELLSRIVEWGERLSAEFDIREVGFNLVKTGTIDSIISELMRDYRAPGEHPPQTINEFVSKGIMLRKALIGRENAYRRKEIERYYREINQSNWTNMNELCNFLNLFKDKILYDMVDMEKFMQNNPNAEKAIEAIEIYINELKERKLFDFSLLASYFLNRLREGAMADFLKNIKFLLIDEYQDTNYLQEQIYFEIAKSAVANGGSITVVGDDDQSLYRFRGATVELFIDFPKRIEAQIGVKPKTVYLSYNYRSTINIVKFFNKFASLGEKYKQIRAGNKPIMYPARSTGFCNYPILGMFRNSREELAKDLAEFIHRVLNGGYRFEWRGTEYLIKAESVSDIVLLCPSPKEEIYGRARLPKLLREELEKKGIKVFNPRGRNIEKVEVVQLMCGLILECIDTDAQIQSSMNLGDQISSILNSWREKAKSFVNNHSSQELKDFWNAWQERRPLNSSVEPNKTYKVSILELIYSLVKWIQKFQNDPESVAYLELIQRVVDGSKLYNKYNSEVVFKSGSILDSKDSVEDAIRAIFVPIAYGDIDVNEELTEQLQDSMFNIMSIHQSKGLEFPIVIVDVGSDADSDASRNLNYKFFPVEINGRVMRNLSVNLEQELSPYSRAGCYSDRKAIDRAFDDLIRLYFVAYSRAQDVLMLVGLNNLLSEEGSVKNVALGWDRGGEWRREILKDIHFIKEGFR